MRRGMALVVNSPEEATEARTEEQPLGVAETRRRNQKRRVWAAKGTKGKATEGQSAG